METIDEFDQLVKEKSTRIKRQLAPIINMFAIYEIRTEQIQTWIEEMSDEEVRIREEEKAKMYIFLASQVKQILGI